MEFGLPDLESRTQIFQIHTRTMNVERDIRFELLARYVSIAVTTNAQMISRIVDVLQDETCRLCPNSTGADIRSVCTEAGMYAIRSRRKTVTEKDFLDAVQKVRLLHKTCHA